MFGSFDFHIEYKPFERVLNFAFEFDFEMHKEWCCVTWSENGVVSHGLRMVLCLRIGDTVFLSKFNHFDL